MIETSGNAQDSLPKREKNPQKAFMTFFFAFLGGEMLQQYGQLLKKKEFSLREQIFWEQVLPSKSFLVVLG